MSICNLGVMFTEYVRDMPIPTSTEVTQGDSFTLSVENIYSKHTIGNILYIHLREKSGAAALGWFTFTQGSPTQVLIAPPFITAPGVYQLVLESFDNNGSVFSTLKEDVI